jgi:hypothetical protein
VFAVEIFDEVLDQRRQIVEPIAERRQLDREDVQMVIQVLA